MVTNENEEDPVDQLAALIAGIDQMVAAAPQLARAAKGWYDAFEEEGFTSSQALYLAACELLQDAGSPP